MYASHIDLRRRTLHVPKPKGGNKRAFDIPLSRQMILCLVRALRFGREMFPSQAMEWVFPAESASGHLAETKEDRDELSKRRVKCSGSEFPIECSHAYQCLKKAGLILVLDVFLNTSLKGDRGTKSMAGRLVRLSEHSLRLSHRHYAVYPIASESNPALVAFRDWPIEEIRRT